MIVTNWTARVVVNVFARFTPGTNGVTIWPVIFLWPGHLRFNDRLVRHEMKHLEQWRRYWIIGFLFVYYWHHFTKGYKNNPLEIEAKLAEIKK